jgi:hypothetical protein
MSTPQVNVALGVTGQEQVAAALRQLASELGKVKEQEDRTQQSTLALGTLFKSFIGYEVINRMRQFGQEVFTSAVQIGKLSQITGVTAPTLSVMSVAAAKLGVETQALGKGIVILEKNLQMLKQGNSQAAMSFGLVGLSAKDFVGLNTDQKILKVTDAIGKMKNGDEKAAASKLLLGRAGADLIPVLNMLAGEGFARAAEEAEKMGLVLSQDTANAAVAAAVAMDGLKESTKGAITQLYGGLLPALADAADAMVEDVGGASGKGFEILGSYAGTVIKFLIEGLLTIGEIGRVEFALMKAAALDAWDAIRIGGGTAFKSIAEAAHGNFSQAWETIKDGAKSASTAISQHGKDAADAWAAAGHRISETDKNLFDPARIAANQKKRLANLQADPTGDVGTPPGKPDKTTGARMALLKAEAENELAIWKALHAAEAAEDKAAEDRGSMTIAEYFNRRRATVADEAAKEIAIMEAEYKAVAAVKLPVRKTPAENEAQKLQKQKELETIQAHIAIAEVKASQDQIVLDREEYDQKIALARQLESYQAEILGAQGRVFDAAVVKIAQESDAIRVNLAKAGLTPQQIEQVVAELQRAKVLAAQLDESRRQASLAQGAMGLMTGGLDLGVERGDVLDVNRERELSTIYAQEVPQLRAIAASMLEIAKLSGDPQKVLEAEQFAQSVEHIANQADYAHQQWVQFENGIVNGVQGDLSTFFATTISNAKSVGDAFEQLGLSISKTFQKAIGDYVGKQATQKLTGWLHLDKTDGGTKSAASFNSSAARMITAGTTISSAATMLAAAAARLQAAADSLAGGGAGGIGGLGDLFGGNSSSLLSGPYDSFAGDSGHIVTDIPSGATGGQVRGPGSSTSDSIPARLSAGEFVVRSAAVNYYGARLFHSLNAGYAGGGLVGAERLAAVHAMRGGFVVPPVVQMSPPRPAPVVDLAAPPAGGDGVQHHLHEFPPELMHMSFADGLQRILARDWARR